MKDEFVSSPMEFNSFMETSVYKDFCNELDIRIEMLTSKLDDEDMEYSGRDYDLFRGGIRNMRQMKLIFNDMAAAKEADMRQVKGEMDET